MTDFTFWSPTYFAFGRGAEARTGELVRRFGGRKALLHYGGGSAIASGLIDRVKSSLAEAGVEFVARLIYTTSGRALMQAVLNMMLS